MAAVAGGILNMLPPVLPSESWGVSGGKLLSVAAVSKDGKSLLPLAEKPKVATAAEGSIGDTAEDEEEEGAMLTARVGS